MDFVGQKDVADLLKGLVNMCKLRNNDPLVSEDNEGTWYSADSSCVAL